MESSFDASMPLNLTDCPDGLARCTDGRLEKSKLATVGPGSVCPWVPLGGCPGECIEGVLVEEKNATQLCRMEAGPWRESRSAAGAGDCHDSKFECTMSRVIDCDAMQVVAVCTQGCAVDVLDDEVAEGDAVTILCKH